MPDTPVVEPIRVAFTPTFSEYARLMWWVRTRPPIIALFIVAAALAAMMATGSTYSRGMPPWVGPALVAGFFAAVWLYSMYRSLPRKDRMQWDATPELRSPREFIFSADGIAIRTPEANSDFGWSYISDARRTGDLLLLGTRLRLYYPIPVRAFSPGDVPRFEALVREKVPAAKL